MLGATIAGAWYTEKYGFFDFADRLYGTQPSFLAQLRVTYADGAVETLAATGDGWQAFGDGPVVDSGIYPGEHQDLRLARSPGWSTPGFDAASWTSASRVGAGARKPGYENVPVPEARIAPPVRRIDSLPVVDEIPTPSGGTILDFGQNLVGRLRVRVRGAAGQRVVMRHAEVLEDGELSIRPLRNAPRPRRSTWRAATRPSSPASRSTASATPRSPVSRSTRPTSRPSCCTPT